MDIKEQRRERFEKQLIEDNPGAVTILHRRADGSYFNRYVQSAWDGWNSALDSAVVELPVGPPACDVNSTAVCCAIEECRIAIEAAGLKVVAGLKVKP